MLKAADILVPVDFSQTSINAVRVALGIAEPGGDLTLLHVIDRDFVDDAVAAGMGSTEDITSSAAPSSRYSRSRVTSTCR